MKEAVIRLIDIAAPYPHICVDHVMKDGLIIRQPEICKTCSPKACQYRLTTGSPGSFEQCPRGFTIFKADFDGIPFVVNGLRVRGWCRDLPRKAKKRLSTYSVDEPDVINWYKNMQSLVSEVNSLVEEKTSASLSILHDIKTAVSLMFRNAEVLIYDEQGKTFSEKIENASPKMRTLFHSVGLLEERIKLTSLLANPDSASHGQRIRTPVYKIFDKMSKLFYPTANQRSVYINLEGTSYRTSLLFPSFNTIPLVLLENAVKYSLQNQTVTVMVVDVEDGVRASVESFSPRIRPEETAHIFDKYGRGQNAARIASSGSGLGLYLARLVADANNFNIMHEEVGQSVNITGIEYTGNRFYFYVR